MMHTQDKNLDFKGQHFFIGLDVHAKNWSVTIRLKDLYLRTFSMDPSPEGLYNHLKRNYPGGTYHTVYEAGGHVSAHHFKSFRRMTFLVGNALLLSTLHLEKTDRPGIAPLDGSKAMIQSLIETV